MTGPRIEALHAVRIETAHRTVDGRRYETGGCGLLVRGVQCMEWRFACRTRVEKCRDGLALIIPEPLAAQAGLREGRPAELELSGGQLVVRSDGPATLAELIAGITSDNLHSEWVDGAPVGSELL